MVTCEGTLNFVFLYEIGVLTTPRLARRQQYKWNLFYDFLLEIREEFSRVSSHLGTKQLNIADSQVVP